MGALILLMVMLIGLIAVAISLGIWLFALSNIKEKAEKRKVETRCTTTSLVLWVLIFFFPVSYGQSGSNYDAWFAIWTTKTALIVFTPSILAILFSISSRRRRRAITTRDVPAYDSLADAMTDQKAGRAGAAPPPPSFPVSPRSGC